ncbi:hypothetical protein F4808DRAFT_157459 [Astrocystis sublimbata]|nr:hypothetical protein F4808DRAFT_157459 [Astrocystis sublimbata]
MPGLRLYQSATYWMLGGCRPEQHRGGPHNHLLISPTGCYIVQYSGRETQIPAETQILTERHRGTERGERHGDQERICEYLPRRCRRRAAIKVLTVAIVVLFVLMLLLHIYMPHLRQSASCSSAIFSHSGMPGPGCCGLWLCITMYRVNLRNSRASMPPW